MSPQLDCITNDYATRRIESAKCSICPEMGTEIQIGPTGQKLLPLSVV